MTHARDEGGDEKTYPRHNGRSPTHAFLVNRVAVGESRPHTCQVHIRIITGGHVDRHRRIQVGHTVGHTGNAAGHGGGNVGIDGIKGDFDILERAQAAEAHGAGIQIPGEEDVAVGGGLDFEGDIAGDGGITIDIKRETVVVGRVGNVEETGAEAGVGLADFERGRLDDALGRRQQGQQREDLKYAPRRKPHRDNGAFFSFFQTESAGTRGKKLGLIKLVHRETGSAGK